MEQVQESQKHFVDWIKSVVVPDGKTLGQKQPSPCFSRFTESGFQKVPIPAELWEMLSHEYKKVTISKVVCLQLMFWKYKAIPTMEKERCHLSIINCQQVIE